MMSKSLGNDITKNLGGFSGPRYLKESGEVPGCFCFSEFVIFL